MSYAIWNKATQYLVDDVVFFNGDYYKALTTNINSQPPNANWLVLPVGDIAGVIAGVGLSGGGSSGIVSLANAGVLSVDGQTGALTTDCGQFHKNVSQTLSSVASPAFTTLTFQDATYTGAAITRVGGTSTTQFVVNTKGVYSLEAQVQLSGIGAGTLADPTVRLTINVARGAQNNSVLTNQFEITNATPNNPALDLGGSYLLLVGDIISLQVAYYLNPAQSFTVNAQSAAPNDYDLNTFWSYQLIKPLP